MQLAEQTSPQNNKSYFETLLQQSSGIPATPFLSKQCSSHYPLLDFDDICDLKGEETANIWGMIDDPDNVGESPNENMIIQRNLGQEIRKVTQSREQQEAKLLKIMSRRKKLGKKKQGRANEDSQSEEWSASSVSKRGRKIGKRRQRKILSKNS